MRLVCPNCEAKYEVPDDAIPDTGRDVQCASCGHAWFQMRSRPVSTPLPTPVLTEAKDPAPVAEAAAEAVESAVKKALAEATPGAAEKLEKADKKDGKPAAASPPSGAEAPVEPDPTPEAEEAAEAPPSKPVDEKVLTILREEAEREAKSRLEEKRPLESQPELGIDSATQPRKKAAAKKRDPEPEPEPEADTAAKPAARRDLLPDVEEINSTLRPSEDPDADAASDLSDAEPRPARRAFRAGFLLVISFAILGAAIYITAPWLSAKVPALAGPISVFVGLVDDLRLALDGLMRSATRLISGEAG